LNLFNLFLFTLSQTKNLSTDYTKTFEIFNFTNIFLAGGIILLSGQTDDKTGLILAFHNFLENSPTNCLSHAADIGFDEHL